MTEIVYSTTGLGMSPGRLFHNPRFYAGPDDGATRVFIEGDWPKITADYLSRGIPVERLDAVSGDSSGEPLPAMDPPEGLLSAAGDVSIPEDWEAMPWPNLRKLAQSLSAVPVLNKTDAAAAISAELARRGDVGLTVTEICADLEAMGLEFDPTESRDELLAQRNAGRRARG